MKKIQFFDRRAVNMTLALAMLLGIIAPALSPVGVSAGLMTSRKIVMSSSAISATDVDYELTFTPETSAASGVVIIEFCDDSPIIGQACGAPTGFDASAASTPSGVTDLSPTTLKVAQALVAATPVTLTFDNIVNPSYLTTINAGEGFYARVYTYADATAANGYTDADTLGTYLDAGGIALAITNPIQVSAAVRETMTFCVSKVDPTQNCTGTTTPSLVLGHGTPEALDASATDTAQAFTQISTNASGGAVVNMKIDNECGGLERQGGTNNVCEIGPQVTSSVLAPGAAAKFGLNVGAATNPVGATVTPSGDTTAQAPYSTGSQYGMDWVSGNATGVGSSYGDTIFTTGGAPVNNKNTPLTFAASVTSTTPAGLYKAVLNLVATGTY